METKGQPLMYRIVCPGSSCSRRGFAVRISKFNILLCDKCGGMLNLYNHIAIQKRKEHT